MQFKLNIAGAKLALLAVAATGVQAAPVFFTDPASFSTALAGLSTPAVLQNFDGVPSGTTIASGTSFAGIGYATSTGFDLVVGTGVDTVSAPNFLGKDSPGNFLASGDEIEFSFSPSVGSNWPFTQSGHQASMIRTASAWS